MNAIAAPRQAGTNIVTAEQAAALRTALKTSLYPGANDASVDMVLAYCQAAQLDPMTKPVHLVPMRVKKPGTQDQYEWRDVVMPGIELYRTKAHNTKLYAGQDDAEFGPEITRKLGALEMTFPEWCKVTVYKLVGTARVAFSAKVYWLESYAQVKNDNAAPNAMWKKRPFGQLEKCAEALALRKAFPEAVGAQPTSDEMEGKDVIEGDFAVVQSGGVAMPQAKQESPKSEPANSGSGAADPAAGGEASAAGDASPQGAGIHGLTAGQQKILATKAKNAGLLSDGGEMDEAALLRLHPLITKDNINDVLADLQKRAELQDAG